MEQPIYVLRANEPAWMPKKNCKWIVFWKRAVRVFLIAILAVSLFFQDNLFSSLSFGPKALIILLFLGTLFIKEKEKKPMPFEIRFYSDYLVLYRESRYDSPKANRMECNKFEYKDMKRILYRPETDRINIYGIVERSWYNYNKDGSLPQEPTYHKIVDSLVFFYTEEAPEVDFVAVFEEYTPLKVTIENN